MVPKLFLVSPAASWRDFLLHRRPFDWQHKWQRNILSSGYFSATSEHFVCVCVFSLHLHHLWQPRRVPRSFCSYCGGNREGETLTVCPAARWSRISQKMSHQRGGRTTLIHNPKESSLFQHHLLLQTAKSLAPPPTPYYSFPVLALRKCVRLCFSPLDCCNIFHLDPVSSFRRRRRPWPSAQATKTSP